VENNTAHFSVSEAQFDNLPAQIQDAILFLGVNRAAIESLMSTAQASGELDFATEYESGSLTSRPVTAELVRLAAALGLGITVSGYPSSQTRREQA
jgi:hypothetical protein